MSAISVPWRVLTGSPPIPRGRSEPVSCLVKWVQLGDPWAAGRALDQQLPAETRGGPSFLWLRPASVKWGPLQRQWEQAVNPGRGQEQPPGVRTKSCFLGNANDCCHRGAQGGSVRTPQPQPCTRSAPCACAGNHCAASLRPGHRALLSALPSASPLPPVCALLLRGELQAGRTG